MPHAGASVLYPFGSHDPFGAAGAQRPEPAWLASLDDPIDSSEAEAYMAFRRMARAFRAWRTNSYLLKHSRMERDLAVRNWTIATAFWEVHLLQRCFGRWRFWRRDTLGAALAVWTTSALQERFRCGQAPPPIMDAAAMRSPPSCPVGSESHKVMLCASWWHQHVECHISTRCARSFCCLTGAMSRSGCPWCCCRWWLEWTRHLRACTLGARTHWLRALLRRWRLFAATSSHKARTALT